MKSLQHYVFTVLFALCSLTASAEEFNVDGIYYNSYYPYMDGIDEWKDNYISVTDNSNSLSQPSLYSGSVVIPSSVTYNGQIYEVKRISAFYGPGLTSVYIPASVTRVSGFYDCINLTYVSFESDETQIESGAFGGCTALPLIDGIRYAGNYAVWVEDKTKTSYTIKEGTVGLAGSLFGECKQMQSVVLPNSLKTIGDYCFSGCNNLASVTIPSNVTNIGDGAFYNCTGLPLIDGVYYADTYAAFVSDKNLTSCDIKEGTRFLANDLFNDCKQLQSVTLPNSVTVIGKRAFAGSGIKAIDIPYGVTEIAASTFGGCCLDHIELPNSVTKIGSGALSCNCQYVIIPSSVTDIALNAFSGCQIVAVINQSGVNLFGPVDKYGNTYFPNWNPYPSPWDGDTYPKIIDYGYKDGDFIWDGYSRLIFYIGEDANVVVPEQIKEIGNYAFYTHSAFYKYLHSIILPNVTQIQERAFEGCGFLEFIVFGSGIKKEPYYYWSSEVFSGHTESYTTTVLNFSDLNIAKYEPYEPSEENADLCLSVDKIYNAPYQDGDFIYYDNSCTNLALYVGKEQEVTVPSTVLKIGHNAFAYNNHLISVTIPENVVNIGEMAFNSCQNLNYVTVENPVPANIWLEYGIFDGTATIKTLQVPIGSVEAYAAAEQWKQFTNIIDGEEEAPEIALNDTEAYTNTKGKRDANINYTRNFTSTNWQPLYIPFNMSYAEWSEYADVAEIRGIYSYDDDEGVERTVLAFHKLAGGELQPNTPYVIRPKEEGEVTFNCTGKTLEAAENGSVWCASTRKKYTLTGTYQPKTNMNGVYAMSGGAFYMGGSDSPALSPYRIYLTIEDMDNGYGGTVANAPRYVQIVVDDEVTGIEGVTTGCKSDGVCYDLSGRRVNKPSQGVYICNGKKVYVK